MKKENKLKFTLDLDIDACRDLTRALHDASANAIKENEYRKAAFYREVKDSLFDAVQANKVFMKNGLKELGWAQ